MYILLDTNVVAAYYLPRSMKSIRANERIEIIFDSVRSGTANHFFYLPNFCVAEVFSVFMKYAFGSWNPHVINRGGTIGKRIYKQLVDQFQDDIHNGKFIYHYELSRYHILAINLIAPIDHYFQISRVKGKNRNIVPMGTFDHLIIAMGIHLAHIHGNDKVAIISADDRLIDILAKCKSGINHNTISKLKLDIAEELTGKRFGSDLFPKYLNLKTANKNMLREVLGEWPLPINMDQLPTVYRYKK